MKLLSKTEIESSIRKDNDELIERNIRLKKFEQEALRRINKLRESGLNKPKIEKEFEEFVRDIQSKKSRLLEELNDIQKLVLSNKEVYYGLVEKQDILEEKLFELEIREKKLDDREQFVKESEQKLKEKLDKALQC